MNKNVVRTEVGENSENVCVSGVQSTTEKIFDFYGKLFLDNTGDGTLGYISGAVFKKGRESSKEFGKRLALEKSDKYVLQSTLYFTSQDLGRSILYTAPDFTIIFINCKY